MRESKPARQQAHGARRIAKARAVAAFLHAVRNARWEEEEEIRQVLAVEAPAPTAADDVVLLEALTRYHWKRHWRHWPPVPRDG